MTRLIINDNQTNNSKINEMKEMYVFLNIFFHRLTRTHF